MIIRIRRRGHDGALRGAKASPGGEPLCERVSGQRRGNETRPQHGVTPRGLVCRLLLLLLLAAWTPLAQANTNFIFTDVPAEDPTWTYPISQRILEDRQDLLRVVSDDSRLDDSYPPDDDIHAMIDATVAKTQGDEMLVRVVANEALEEMFAAAKEEGVYLLIHSAYRSHYRQAVLHELRVKDMGYDDGYVQEGGASDHQTGLGFDIVTKEWVGKRFNKEFAETKAGQWMAENCARFGFILRYPEDKVELTGVPFEPWHLRYVGREVAAHIMAEGLTLEEFHEQWQRAKAAHEAAEFEPSLGALPPSATEAEETGHPAWSEILITAAGDVTLGANMKENPRSTFYSRIVDANNGDLSYFFRNVSEYFSKDDLTIVNFEGTLTGATRSNSNTFCFRAPPEHVGVLTQGSVEAVSFENNHVDDFQQQGYEDTIRAFEEAGVIYSTEAHVGEYTVKGVRIGMLSYLTIDEYDRLFAKVPEDIRAARGKYDIVIVSFHWGYEKDFAPRENQIKMGRLAVDSGADLVLGHHSHRVNPIELYNGRYIVYSLANCSFSGNTRPDNMDTFLFQQKFFVQEDGARPGPIRIIPCSISSYTAERGLESGDNDLAITPFPPESEAIGRVVGRMLSEGQTLEYALTEYPLEWGR